MLGHQFEFLHRQYIIKRFVLEFVDAQNIIRIVYGLAVWSLVHSELVIGYHHNHDWWTIMLFYQVYYIVAGISVDNARLSSKTDHPETF